MNFWRTVDYDEIEGMEAVLSAYGSSAYLSERWKTIRCPFTDRHSHGDSNPSARAKTTAFVCHGCGAKGNCISLIMEVESVGRDCAIRKYEEYTGAQYKRVRDTVTRKSWGTKPFGKRDFERDTKSFSSRLRRKPFDGGQ